MTHSWTKRYSLHPILMDVEPSLALPIVIIKPFDLATGDKVARFDIPKLDDVDVKIVPETNNPSKRNNLNASMIAVAGDIS